MPSYSRWGFHAHQNNRLPPTPPDYQTSYLTPMSAMSDVQGYYGNSRHSFAPRDYQDRFQPSVYNTHHAHSRSKQMHGQDYTMNYPQPIATQYQFGSGTAPILPPIQAPNDLSQYPAQYPVHAESKAKEEKPTGGVAQHLDYEMDLMASFVSEMCHQMVTRTSASPTSQFRKYVSQILSSTRLPSSTIMLGLFYLQERMKIEVSLRTDLSSSGSLMRMLTTCLLLGSKFLDDNTFQNRSWAEVSNIPVQKLNAMELEWLKGFDWEIHRLMYEREEGFFMWIEHWHSYEEKAQAAKHKELHKLTPINTSLSRHSSVHQPMMSPEGPIPPQYQQNDQYDTRWARPLMSQYSPPSAPHSGPTTPEYYNAWNYTPMSGAHARSSWYTTKSAYPSQRSQFDLYHAAYQNSAYANATAWMSHGLNCNCALCGQKSEYYVGPAGYPMQPVVG